MIDYVSDHFESRDDEAFREALEAKYLPGHDEYIAELVWLAVASNTKLSNYYKAESLYFDIAVIVVATELVSSI